MLDDGSKDYYRYSREQKSDQRTDYVKEPFKKGLPKGQHLH